MKPKHMAVKRKKGFSTATTARKKVVYINQIKKHISLVTVNAFSSANTGRILLNLINSIKHIASNHKAGSN